MTEGDIDGTMQHMEKKYTPFLVIGIIVALLFAVLVFARLKRNPISQPDTYNEVSPSAELALDFNAHRYYVFSRDDCIHCQNLNDYFAQHEGIRDQFDIVEANLSLPSTSQYFYNKAIEFTQLCQGDVNQIGTPLMYINDETVPLTQRCLAGDTPIMAYFDTQLEGQPLVETQPVSLETLDLE